MQSPSTIAVTLSCNGKRACSLCPRGDGPTRTRAEVVADVMTMSAAGQTGQPLVTF